MVRYMQNIITLKKILKEPFFYIICSLILLIVCCVDPFVPEINDRSDLLVVDGSIVKGRGLQYINISTSSAINQPEYIPVEHCTVIVSDSSGNEFNFFEISKGQYVLYIEDAQLDYDNKYKLILRIPGRGTYESRYQTLLKTPPVDSIYGIVENRYSDYTKKESLRGLQFYVDLKASDDASRFYRWKIEETWEYHAEERTDGYFDGYYLHFFSRPSESVFYCWKTKDINGLYSSSTSDLIRNEKKKIPLYYIDAASNKLWVKYCATVKQYALNEDAYNYWEQKKQEINESGGFYTTQPSQLKSNIYNINNPDEQILGYFWASSVTKKRMFFENPFYKEVESACSSYGGLFIYDKNNIQGDSVYAYYFTTPDQNILLPDPPFYIYKDHGILFTTVPRKCLDCTADGGINQKPDFWE